MALSQGMRAKLEAQRLMLKERLEELDSQDPPPALLLDSDAVVPSANSINVCVLHCSQYLLIVLVA